MQGWLCDRVKPEKTLLTNKQAHSEDFLGLHIAMHTQGREREREREKERASEREIEAITLFNHRGCCVRAEACSKGTAARLILSAAVSWLRYPLHQASPMVSPWRCVRCIVTATMFASFLALLADNMVLPRSMQGSFIAHSEEQAANMCRIEDRGCLQAGTWVQSGQKEEQIFPLYEGCSKRFFHICAKPNAAWKSLGFNVSATGAQDFRMRRLLSWLWVPANVECNLSSRSSLLEALSGRRVLLIGDSITKEHYVSLRCLVGDAAVKEEREHLQPPEHSVVSLHGGGFIQFYRLNTFVQESTDVVTPDWPSQLVHEADVVILNTGAHKHARIRDGQNRTAVAEMAQTVAKTLQSQNQHGVFIFRSHFLPHANCEEVTAPIGSLDRVPRLTPFNWNTFADQDEEWRNVFESSGPRFIFYNITFATSLRADAHTVLLKTPSIRDCLHFCLPGVVDLWSLYIIVDVFQKLRSCQSVEAASQASKNSIPSDCERPSMRTW